MQIIFAVHREYNESFFILHLIGYNLIVCIHILHPIGYKIRTCHDSNFAILTQYRFSDRGFYLRADDTVKYHCCDNPAYYSPCKRFLPLRKRLLSSSNSLFPDAGIRLLCYTSAYQCFSFLSYHFCPPIVTEILVTTNRGQFFAEYMKTFPGTFSDCVEKKKETRRMNCVILIVHLLLP